MRTQNTGLSARARAFPATYGLLAVSIGVFVLQLLTEISFGFDIVLALGAKVNDAIAAGEVWRLVTPIFIHGGLLHLFVNMYSLQAIGPSAERLLGTPRVLAFYLIAGLGGVTLSLALTPHPSIGASGALFGLLGVLGAFLLRHRPILGASAEVSLRRIGMVALLNLGLGLIPGIDNWGHVGGLVTGAALTWFFGPRLELEIVELTGVRYVDRRPWKAVRRQALAVAGVIILLALAAARFPLAF
jgi:membrane associated rhomboid family serine protease